VIRSSKLRDLPAAAPTVQLAPVELEAIVQAGDLAAGSRPVKLGSAGKPTVALSPIEIDALIHGAEQAADPSNRPTVEHVRIARGTDSQPAEGRGPRRARETLCADSIRRPSTGAPTRKR
jgi:hypothetical protein